MDGCTRMDEMRYFRQRIPSADYVPERVPERAEPGKEFVALWERSTGCRA
jgi:hypothetical protein